jgi:hypothetical protein
MEYLHNFEPREKKKRNPYLGLYIGLFLLLLVLVPLLILSIDRGQRVETEGTIVAFDEEDHPIVEYEVGGRTYTFHTTNLFSRRKDDRVGSTMTLLYLPDAPDNAKAVHLYHSAAAVFAFPGVIVIVIWAIRRFLKNRKEMRGEEDEIPQETESKIPQAADTGTPQEIDRGREYEMQREAERKLAAHILGRPFRIFAWFFICFGALFVIIGLAEMADNTKTGVGVMIVGFVIAGLGFLIKKIFSARK